MPRGPGPRVEAGRQTGKWIGPLAAAIAIAAAIFVVIIASISFLEVRIERAINDASPWMAERSGVLEKITANSKRLEAIEGHAKLAQQNAEQLKRNQRVLERLEKAVAVISKAMDESPP